MESVADFSFEPLPPIEDPATVASDAERLGPLAGLAGKWAGQGFNVIWRPHQPPGIPDQDHFLELNVTSEQLDFGPALRDIPNRGLLQGNIRLFGLNYLQQISDANLDAPQHFEPGLWVRVPQTSQPKEDSTVARLASIPHGTTILAQGFASTSAGAPSIPDVSIRPFPIGEPGTERHFVEQHLDTPSHRRTSGVGLAGITQQMVDNPNSVLRMTPSPPITATTRLHVSTSDPRIPGGGTRNIAFLTGVALAGSPPPAGGIGPNAVTAHVRATFWLETFQGDQDPRQLQYSQRVLLNFDGLSWPHVTVATLHKQD
jgi:hypothetical protein